MNAQLHALAAEVLSRLSGNRAPKERPQLLGCRDGICLLRAQDGLREVPAAQLPAQVDLAPLIDHTLLKPSAWLAEIDQLCDEALEYEFASVCVNPHWVPRCARRLEGSVVRVCTVIGFPLGANTSRIKAEEAREAVANGAREVDMVLAVGLARAGDWESVRRDYRAVREAVPTAVVKVILETCLLTDEEKTHASRIAAEEGLDFVKTSTGFSTGGATEADVRLMRETVGARSGVKASGGVRTYEDALKMVLAGATRLGLSSSLAVAKGVGAQGGGY
jgi:deoxyribose-phosphate aldolase